jgi:hypothetical protein
VKFNQFGTGFTKLKKMIKVAEAAREFSTCQRVLKQTTGQAVSSDTEVKEITNALPGQTRGILSRLKV